MEPSAPTTTDSSSINTAAKAKASINLRIHFTSPAAPTVPASRPASKEKVNSKLGTPTPTPTKPGGLPKVGAGGIGYSANMLTDLLTQGSTEL
jgi:hypothetical protein